MEENVDNKFMRRCLELASKAEGMTYPNPLVGSVVVCDGKIIGEGYHLRAGGPHAEVIAINSVQEKEKLTHSTLYVNLEPCSHFGKTPPCADFIIASAIPRVIIGTTDTSEKVSGLGAARLREAGCEVKTGVIEQECRSLNKRFFTFHEKRRPYIILKWAQSADGYIDILRQGKKIAGPVWISGKPERVLVHKWRAAEQAILVGAGTVKADNPKLTVREWTGNNPVKIILGNPGHLHDKQNVNETEGDLIIFSHNSDSVKQGGINVKLNSNVHSSAQIAGYLYDSGFQSLFIEGGAKVLNHFISTGLWDEARVFTGIQVFNEGISAPRITGTLLSATKFSGSSLEIYLNET